MKKIITGILMIIILLGIIAVYPNYSNAAELKEENLTGIYLKDDTSAPGGKVGVNFLMLGDLTNVTVNLNFFCREQSKSFNVQLQDVGNKNAYITLPEDLPEGKYEMMYVDIRDGENYLKCSTNKIEDFPYIITSGQRYITVKEEEEKLTLTKFGFKQNKAKIDEKVYLDAVFTGNYDEISSITMTFYNSETSSRPIIYASGVSEGEPYIVIDGIDDKRGASEPFLEGLTYKVKEVSVWYKAGGFDSYTLKNMGEEPILEIISDVIEEPKEDVTEETTSELKGIYFDENNLKEIEANLNDKINVKLDYEGKPLESVMLSFTYEETEEFVVVYLKDLAKDPYFIVPMTIKEGTYSINYVLLTDEDNNRIHYRIGPASGEIRHIDFECTLKVKENIAKNSDGAYVFDNTYINEYIDIISKLEENIVITINANETSKIPAELFESIKGKDKTLLIEHNEHQWIFYGKDIISPKEIDVSIISRNIEDVKNQKLNNIVSNGLILDFAENGYLPGKALIRIKVDKVNLDEGKKYYTFYYDEVVGNLQRVTFEKTVTEDGYYEFYINHNSSYIITNEIVKDEYISNKTDGLELNGEKTNENVTTEKVTVPEKNVEKEMDETLKLKLLIIILCIVILVIIFVTSKKKKKTE